MTDIDPRIEAAMYHLAALEDTAGIRLTPDQQQWVLGQSLAAGLTRMATAEAFQEVAGLNDDLTPDPLYHPEPEEPDLEPDDIEPVPQDIDALAEQLAGMTEEEIRASVPPDVMAFADGVMRHKLQLEARFGRPLLDREVRDLGVAGWEQLRRGDALDLDGAIDEKSLDCGTKNGRMNYMLARWQQDQAPEVDPAEFMEQLRRRRMGPIENQDREFDLTIERDRMDYAELARRGAEFEDA